MGMLDLFNEVRTILLTDWDPCDIGGNAALWDEYNDYIPAIVGLIKHRQPIEIISDALLDVEKDLGVSLPENQRVLAMKKIAALMESYTEETEPKKAKESRTGADFSSYSAE